MEVMREERCCILRVGWTGTLHGNYGVYRLVVHRDYSISMLMMMRIAESRYDYGNMNIH